MQPDKPTLTPSEKVQLLTTEYSLLKQEIWSYTASYKSHVRSVQLVLAALFAASPFFATDSFKKLVALVGIQLDYLLLFGMALFTTIVFYFVWDILESQYATIVVSSRMAIIEKGINLEAHENLLTMESQAAPLLWNPTGPFRWQMPSNYLAAYLSVLVAAAAVAIPVYYDVLVLSRTTSVVVASVAVVLVLYSVGSQMVATYVGVSMTRNFRAKARQEIAM